MLLSDLAKSGLESGAWVDGKIPAGKNEKLLLLVDIHLNTPLK